MGGAASAFSKMDWSSPAGDDVKEEAVDPRRRNSLAFNISRYVTWQEDDFNPLCDEVRNNLVATGAVKKEKVTKFSRIADAVSRGDFRELKVQVVNFQTINRKFGDQFNQSNLIHMICQEAYPKMIEFILEPKNHAEADHVQFEVDPLNNKKRTPLFLLFTPPSATYLGLRQGLDEEGNPKNNVPVGVAWFRPGGQAEREACLSYLISQRCNVNAKDFHDFTAMHYAAMWGWVGAIKQLSAAGADINAITVTGKTPLMYACEYLHEEAIAAMVKLPKIQLNLADSDGQTALLIAMSHGEDALYVLETLLQAGVDGNQMNHKKRTPLHIACANQQAKQVHMLLNFKCHRRNSAFELLEGEAAKDIQKRIMDEERAAAESFAKQEKERERLAKEGLINTAEAGYKNKDPYGQWVEFVDKRDGSSFYYNKVSRESRKDKPKDFKPDRKRIVKETTFGHSFYH